MLREIYDLLIDHQGEDERRPQDRFVIHLFDDSGSGVELRFPNQSTACSPQLLQDLEALVGTQGVQVEDIAKVH